MFNFTKYLYENNTSNLLNKSATILLSIYKKYYFITLKHAKWIIREQFRLIYVYLPQSYIVLWKAGYGIII